MNGRVLMRVGILGAVMGAAGWAVAQMPADPMQNPASPTSNPMNPALPTPPQPGPANPAGTQPTTLGGALGAPGQTGRQMHDQQFLMKAAAGGLAEVKLGMLAAQKGGPEVKELGQKMVDDHTALNKEMGDVADGMGVMLPRKMSKEDQAEYDKLNALQGDEFEREYIEYVLKNHREDLHDFRMEASAAVDSNLQAEAMKASGMIRHHLQMVTKLAEDKGLPVPPRDQKAKQ